MNFRNSSPCSWSRFTPSSLSHLVTNTLGISHTARPQSRRMSWPCPRIALMCSTIVSQSCQCSTARSCLCTRSRTPERVTELPARLSHRRSVIAAVAAVFDQLQRDAERLVGGRYVSRAGRSEEHTSELQSHSFISYAVF